MPAARIGGGNWHGGVCLAAATCTLAMRAQRIAPLMNAAAAVVVAFWLLPMVVLISLVHLLCKRLSLARSYCIDFGFQSLLSFCAFVSFLDLATDGRTRNDPEASEASPACAHFQAKAWFRASEFRLLPCVAVCFRKRPRGYQTHITLASRLFAFLDIVSYSADRVFLSYYSANPAVSPEQPKNLVGQT